jgi:AraC-like DNA-binding protein
MAWPLPCRADVGEWLESGRAADDDTMATTRKTAGSRKTGTAEPEGADAPPAPTVIPAPIEPMLAKLIDALPAEGEYLFEPKWDGFRAIVFRDRPGEVAIQSRDLRPLDRYFPELRSALLTLLPDGTIVDGEIVVVGARGLDFDALQQRLHPAASRVAKLARATPASFVAFDLLAAGNSVTDACVEVGFSSLGSFSTLFTRWVGVAPSAWRRSIQVPRAYAPIVIPGCVGMMAQLPPDAWSHFREAPRG